MKIEQNLTIDLIVDWFVCCNVCYVSSSLVTGMKKGIACFPKAHCVLKWLLSSARQTCLVSCQSSETIRLFIMFSCQCSEVGYHRKSNIFDIFDILLQIDSAHYKNYIVSYYWPRTGSLVSIVFWLLFSSWKGQSFLEQHSLLSGYGLW